MRGLKLAAIYGYPPSRLGFCGLGTDKNLRIITGFIRGDESKVKSVRKILSSFEAAYSYYRLIAKSNCLKDPFEPKVVEAYWLGNKLLSKVNGNDLKTMIRSDFVRPGLLSAKQAEAKINLLKKGVLPSHLFHVLFIGSITGRVNFTNKAIDVCRIGWGKVIKIAKTKGQKTNKGFNSQNLKQVVVNYQPLLKENNQWQLNKAMERQITWDRRLVPELKEGDVVSFHWNWVCAVLNRNQLSNLTKYTLLVGQSLSGQHR